MELIKRSLKPNTRLLWLETPSNPLLKVVDIEALVEVVRRHNKDILIVVDNTFMTPFFQKPLELGVDVVVYSLTKYVNGHADVVMGATMTNSEQLDKHFHDMQKCKYLKRILITEEISTSSFSHRRSAIPLRRVLGEPSVEDTARPHGASHAERASHRPLPGPAPPSGASELPRAGLSPPARHPQTADDRHERHALLLHQGRRR